MPTREVGTAVVDVPQAIVFRHRELFEAHRVLQDASAVYERRDRPVCRVDLIRGRLDRDIVGNIEAMVDTVEAFSLELALDRAAVLVVDIDDDHEIAGPRKPLHRGVANATRPARNHDHAAAFVLNTFRHRR